MRAVYEQSTDREPDAAAATPTDRFTELVRDMKQMTDEMQHELVNTRTQIQREMEGARATVQHELEATREEVRRGVLELPQETAESAAQMRRVLVDQIEALGRTQPHRRPPRPQSGHRRAGPPAAARGSATRGACRLATIRGRRNARATSPASPRRHARVPTPARPLRPQAANNKGWLSDLLTRASREEDAAPAARARPAPREAPRDLPRNDERSPRHSIESLDSLSVDIARMIDHDAAADLWDRYKRGERNVFTRRLYTLQGQKAFDEIRTKYRADREFKQTVDRYIAEFERLLEEVSRDDRGQVVARTYLTSETGKVYTMLAHAAGRFD